MYWNRAMDFESKYKPLNYKSKCYKMSEDPSKEIWVYDDILTFNMRTHIYEMCSKSNYKIIGSDNGVLEYKSHISVVSTYSINDFKGTQLLEHLPPEVIERHRLSYKHHDDTMINMCTPSDRFHTHVDNGSDGWTMIYCSNMNWNVEWGGNTFFLNEAGDEIEYTNTYKPGRLVFFNPRIPHLIQPPTVFAPHFRFTLATKFIPEDLVPMTDGSLSLDNE